MKNFDRQYRLKIGKAGGSGFEIGDGEFPLRISFSVERADTDSANTAKISIYNLNKQHIAALKKKDCAVALNAGYGDVRPLVFSGIVTFSKTKKQGSDTVTEVELVDNRVELRDTYVSLHYKGKVNCKKIIQDAANQMGVAVSFSYNATFKTLSNGFSFVGAAKNLLTKICKACSLSWGLHNGVLLIKRPYDSMSKRAYEISSSTGLVGSPERVQVTTSKDKTELGWDIEFLMNAAINIGDYIHLKSDAVKGYFRVHSIQIDGDSTEGSWTCTARLLGA